jgi:hypothetical protein
MTTQQLELLHPVTHGALTVLGWKGPRPRFVQIVTEEFAAAAATCPILVAKSAETGRFFVGAMFGFKPGEDLAIEPGEETGAFIPLDLERNGFYIRGEEIAIDPANPCFAAAHGAPLFEASGEPADALRHRQRVLGRLKAGVEDTDAFVATMMEHKLIEPIDISLRFDDGESLQLEGLYSVSLDALHDLDDATALALFRGGQLQLAYAMVGSLRQIPVLARRRNQRLSQG